MRVVATAVFASLVLVACSDGESSSETEAAADTAAEVSVSTDAEPSSTITIEFADGEATDADEDGWFVYQSEDGAYSAMFPAQVAEALAPKPTEDAPQVYAAASDLGADGAYVVSYFFRPDPAYEFSAAQAAGGTIESALAGTVTSIEQVTISGADCTRVTGDIEAGNQIDQLYCDRGERIYTAQYLGPGADAESIDRFFGSLEFSE